MKLFYQDFDGTNFNTYDECKTYEDERAIRSVIEFVDFFNGAGKALFFSEIQDVREGTMFIHNHVNLNDDEFASFSARLKDPEFPEDDFFKGYSSAKGWYIWDDVEEHYNYLSEEQVEILTNKLPH